MTAHDVFLLSPEISVAGLAVLVMALDLFVRRKTYLYVTAVVGLSVPFALSIVLWNEVHVDANGEIVGVMGALIVDKFSLFFKFLILGITALVLAASLDYSRRISLLRGEFIGLILLSATGMMLLSSTRELITIYISLELTTLPLIALTTFLMTARSSEAGLKFLVLSAISSAFLLYGMVLIYGLVGSTYLVDIAGLAEHSTNSGIPFGSYSVLLVTILVVAGLGFKVSAVPFHMWVPDVYQGAPTPVIAFLSVASKAAGFAVLLRIFYVAFPGFEADWAVVFAFVAAFSMTLGNLVAMVQSNIKRLLGYSTIAHAGYILVGLAAVASRIENGGEVSGPNSILFYLCAYAATNLAAIFAIIGISNKIGSHEIDDFSGMGKKAPFLAAALTISMISLIGIPPTGLFIGKIFLFTAAIQADLAWLAFLGVINSVISAYYYLRIVRVMYMTEAGITGIIGTVPSSFPFKLALSISTLAILITGVAPGLITWITDAAASVLLP